MGGKHLMCRKTKNFLIACAVFSAITLALGTNAFSASYKSLYGHFKDLPGWKGEKPKGMQANIGGIKMITASRLYQQKGKKVTAAIIFGQQAQGMMPPASRRKEMTMDTPQGKILIKKVKGVYIQMVYEKARKQGTILVPLSTGKQKVPAVFMFHFKGLSLAEGKELAEKFDWKDMKKKLQVFK